jgi:hypothetical protein
MTIKALVKTARVHQRNPLRMHSDGPMSTLKPSWETRKRKEPLTGSLTTCREADSEPKPFGNSTS